MLNRIKWIAPFLVLGALSSFAQTARITPWKNNATGAYSLTHDDYGTGAANGIRDYVDTICYNRGIAMSFGPSAYACNTSDWNNINTMINVHGHEIMNHTWSHLCDNSDFNTVQWCVDMGTWGIPDYPTEIVGTDDKIEQHCGTRPRFFIYPFDQFTASTESYLRNDQNYLGSRTGTYDDTYGSLNAFNMSDPSKPGFWVTRDGVSGSRTDMTPAQFNAYVDIAINEGKWGVREFHGVGDNSWGNVTPADYRVHIDYLKQKVADGTLWVPTMTEAITYIMQNKSYSVSANYDAGNSRIDVTLTKTNGSFDPTTVLGDRVFASPVTLEIEITQLAGVTSVYQGANQVTDYFTEGNYAYINVYPSDGNVIINSAGSGGGVNEPYQGVMAVVPGVIQMEYYDEGGVDVAYGESNQASDPTPVFRLDEEVDLVSSTDPNNSNGIVLGHTQPGEYLYYTTNVQQTDVYQAKIRYSTLGTGNQIRLYDGNTDVLGNITLPNTGGLDNWATLEVSDISLSTGVKEFRLFLQDGNINVNYIEFVKQPSSPYLGSPVSVPGRIEAENFDLDGSGISYNEVNQAWDPTELLYRSDYPTTVDIRQSSDPSDPSGYHIGYTYSGEWLAYTIDVDQAGTYDLDIRLATADGIRNLQLLDEDGVDLISNYSVPNTGGWDVFQTVTVSNVDLKQGVQTLKLYWPSGNVDVNWFEFRLSSASSPIADFTADRTIVCEGQTVNFTDMSTNATSYSWSFGAGANPSSASGAGPHTVVYSGSGNKTISLTVNGVDTEVKTNYLMVDVCTNVNSGINESLVNVYPNPTTDYLIIEGVDVDQYYLYNVSGELISQGIESKVDMNNMPKGVYIIQIQSSGDATSIKVVKE